MKRLPMKQTYLSTRGFKRLRLGLQPEKFGPKPAMNFSGNWVFRALQEHCKRDDPMVRQRLRPYHFNNHPPPGHPVTKIEVVDGHKVVQISKPLSDMKLAAARARNRAAAASALAELAKLPFRPAAPLQPTPPGLQPCRCNSTNCPLCRSDPVPLDTAQRQHFAQLASERQYPATAANGGASGAADYEPPEIRLNRAGRRPVGLPPLAPEPNENERKRKRVQLSDETTRPMLSEQDKLNIKYRASLRGKWE